MTRPGRGKAALRVASLQKSGTSLRDTYFEHLATEAGPQVATAAKVRINETIANLHGLDTHSREVPQEEWRAFNAWRDDKLGAVLDGYEAQVRTDALAGVGIDVVPLSAPTALVYHERSDDSSFIMVDNSLREVFAILVPAAMFAYRKRDMGPYHDCLAHTFMMCHQVPHPTILNALSGLAMAYLSLPDDMQRLVDLVRDWCMAFVICHEAAHLELGHFDRLTPLKLKLAGEEADAEPSEVSLFPAASQATRQQIYEIEFEADDRGADRLIGMKSSDVEQDMISVIPALALTMLEHLSMFGMEMSYLDKALRRYHPPEQDRRIRASKKFNDRIKAQDNLISEEAMYPLNLVRFLVQFERPDPKQVEAEMVGLGLDEEMERLLAEAKEMIDKMDL